MKNHKKMVFCAVCACFTLIMTSFSAFAHGVWVETRLDKLTLVLGEGYKDNAYDPKMVTKVQGYSKDYSETSVTTNEYTDHVTFTPSDNTAIIAVDFDYGYWSLNPATGAYEEAPMTEVPGSTVSTYAVKYSVNYIDSVSEVKAVPNMPYQIVPQTDPAKLNVGDNLQVQVVHNGQGLANTDVILDVANNHTITAKTDENGMITVPVNNGATNVIGVELTTPYTLGDGKASQMKVFTSLSFTLYPEESD